MSKTNLRLRTRTYKKLIDEVKTPDYWNEASATLFLTVMMITI